MSEMLVVPTLEELVWMEPAELEAALVMVEHARRVVEAAYVDVLDVADRHRVWVPDGHRTVKNWAVAVTGVSPVEMGRRCQSMRALRDLEGLRERLRAGEVGVCQVRRLGRLHANRRVRARLGPAEELLVGIARKRSYDEFAVRVNRWERAADPAGAARTADEVHAERAVDARFTDAGFTISAHGGVAQGMGLLAVLDAFAEAEFRADWDAARAVHGDDTTVEVLARSEVQRRFDALCAIFEAAATGGGGGVRVPTVNVVCDQTTFEDHLAHAAGGPEPAPADPHDTSRRCETVDGVPLDPRDVAAAALVGHVRRVVLDAAGVVVDAGRKRRLFTGALREVMFVQGSQCLWPGCGTTAREHDHRDEWASGHGCTDPSNCGPMCGRHNRWKTTHGYTTRRDPDGVWHVYRPDGTDITHPRAA